jgi:hypothetical protein
MEKNNLIKTSEKILVDRNIDHVFDFFANPGNDSLWRTEINKSEPDGALQQGVTVSEYSYLSKKAPNNLLQLNCVEFDKNRKAIFETSGDCRFYLKNQRSVKAVSENTTELSYSLEFDKSIVNFALGFSLPSFIVSFKAKADMKKYLRQLKRHLENV